MYNKAINTFGVVLGLGYCQTCRRILAGGVNNPATAASCGKRGLLAWAQFLVDHEAYHTAKGEELPDAFTVRGLSDKMLARVAELQAERDRPTVYVRREPTQEELAIAEFKKFSRPVVKQLNGRHEPGSVRPLDTKAFAGF